MNGMRTTAPTRPSRTRNRYPASAGGQPVAGHGQDRDLHALAAQPGRGHRAGRRGGRAAGYQHDRPARGPQRTLAGPGRLTAPDVPGRAEQPGQGGYPRAAVRPDEDDLARRGLAAAPAQDRPPGAGNRPSSGTRVHPPLPPMSCAGALGRGPGRAIRPR